MNGHLGLFANCSRSQLMDATAYVGATLPGAAEHSKVRDNEILIEGGVFIDPIDALRIGIDYAQYRDTYTDAVTAVNHSVQASGFLFF
jgi:phosphoglucomutase